MNSNKLFNQSINFSKSQTFSSHIINNNLNNERENNDNEKNKFSKSSNYVQLPKNFVPVLRPKKKNSQNLTPLFLNPTQEINNSFDDNNNENYSSSIDIDSENEVDIENNEFYEIKVYYNLEDKIENKNEENNNKENENYLNLLKKNSLIETNNVSKLRKTMRNINSQSSQKKYFKCYEDVINSNLKLKFNDDLTLNNNNNINYNNCFNNDLRPQKYLSFCNSKNISILSVLKKSM